MMIIARFFLIILTLGACFSVKADFDDFPLTTDNRVKTYIYSPNEVYLLVLHFGYHSSIEFSKGEQIQHTILGDLFAWKPISLENRLFIRALEKNIRTNMTVITNKRIYQFDLVAKEFEEDELKDFAYVIRFYYPKKKKKIG